MTYSSKIIICTIMEKQRSAKVRDVDREDVDRKNVWSCRLDMLTGRMKDGNLGKISTYLKPFYKWLDK